MSPDCFSRVMSFERELTSLILNLNTVSSISMKLVFVIRNLALLNLCQLRCLLHARVRSHLVEHCIRIFEEGIDGVVEIMIVSLHRLSRSAEAFDQVDWLDLEKLDSSDGRNISTSNGCEALDFSFTGLFRRGHDDSVIYQLSLSKLISCY